jgi:SPX domain protein involved in polyphosphate accumulation
VRFLLYQNLIIALFSPATQKVTGYTLKPEFSSDYLDKHPFYKYNYDGLIVKLSRLFDLVRTRGHPIEGDSAAGGSQNAFVRSTTKYWVS